MTVTEACEPALPPVSIIMGTHANRTGEIAESRASYVFKMSPVNVALTIKTSSHGIRFFQMPHTLVFK